MLVFVVSPAGYKKKKNSFHTLNTAKFRIAQAKTLS